MIVGQIEVAQSDLSRFCVRNAIKKLALFGSVLRERFSDSSDIDVLVEFEPGYRVGYLRMASMERVLSGLFGGRRVDLRTANKLSVIFETKSYVLRPSNMPPSDLVRLRHMLDAARKAVIFGAGRSHNDLMCDRLRTLALVK